ncbi:hypothetical protein ACFQL1_22305 [Halomicroarcula sp. GCM10025709]
MSSGYSPTYHAPLAAQNALGSTPIGPEDCGSVRLVVQVRPPSRETNSQRSADATSVVAETGQTLTDATRPTYRPRRDFARPVVSLYESPARPPAGTGSSPTRVSPAVVSVRTARFWLTDSVPSWNPPSFIRVSVSV